MAGQIGNKGGGRKTKKEELEAAVETITEEVLLKLARSKVKKHLDKSKTFQQVKDMALPIVLKGMTQKLGGDKDNPFTLKTIIINKSGNGNDKSITKTD